MMNTNKLELFVVSDSVGDTAQRIATATLAQFPELEKINPQRFSFVDSEEKLLAVLKEAVTKDAIVTSIFLDKSLRRQAREFAQQHSLDYIDYMSPLIKAILNKSGLTPKRKARKKYKLTRDDFTKIETIDFAVKYDDGKDPKGFLQADYVILGTSRTSKTPLSIYLASQGYKAANLPLIPSISLPQELFEVPTNKIIGLLASPESVLTTRKSRLKSLGLTEDSTYTDLQIIQNELEYAIEVYSKLGALIVDVDSMGIEEIAEYIIEQTTKC